ncbi:EscU/YscU/HrcU family type III secretion system export apparatus switch protein [Caenispirillum bisanense]|uniref:EscU/YscU/HrcU family type III secretion system export apparatus switch protein n=1 Tax=Caenispirillum bisanense TaxID=414052 RepID=UPI0031E0F4D4
MTDDHDSRAQQTPPQRAVAVALAWNPEHDTAPRVTASGRGAVAEQILQLAWANGVRVREDADLAQILAAIDLDMEIPVEAYAAVAEIMLYVYRANGQEIPPPATAGAFAP